MFANNQPQISANAIDKIVPHSFVMTESGTYQPQALRSWEMAGNMLELNALAKHIGQTCAIQITPELIAQAAPNMMSVSTANQGDIQIVNGWGTRRGVFVLMVDVYYKAGPVVRWIVQGYTDEPSFNDHSVAMGTMFYINNVFSTTQAVRSIDGVRRNTLTMLDNFQMVSGFSGNASMPGGNVLIRPQDVMSQISMREIQHSVGNMIDTTVLASTQPQTSRHSNNIGSSVLAKTLNVWHEAASAEHASATVDVIAERAYTNLIESDPSMNVFMNILTAANNNLGSSTLSFTFGQLQAAIPSIMTIFQSVNTTAGAVQFSHSGQSQHFGGQNLVTRVAANLQALIPSIMVESLLVGVSFSMTNETPGMIPQIVLNGLTAFSPDIDQHQWQIFKRRMLNEVVPVISPPNSGLGFNIIVSCNFFHEFIVEVFINGSDVRFVSPAFCNSLTTPIQTASVTHAQNFSTEMETAATHINDALMESQIRRVNIREARNTSPGSVQAPFRMPQSTSSAMNFPSAPQGGGGMSIGGGMHMSSPSNPVNPSNPSGPVNPNSPSNPSGPNSPSAPVQPRSSGMRIIQR